jgi:hypothetical protein
VLRVAPRGVPAGTAQCSLSLQGESWTHRAFCVACAGQVPQGLHRQRYHVRRHQRGALLHSPFTIWPCPHSCGACASCPGCFHARSHVWSSSTTFFRNGSLRPAQLSLRFVCVLRSV